MFRFSVRPNRAHLVNWREWGEDAFEEAARQGKLVVLFITAFWCGFCQRMDETSLSDDETIALLNAFFVPIRVEESQRPDVDLRYNQNGWPTISFLTPDGGLLFSVNYMDTDPFVDVLVRTVNQMQTDRESLAQAATLPALARPQESEDLDQPPLTASLAAEVAGMVEGLADRENGGYGTHFKFIHAEANEFLLYLHETTGEAAYLDHVTFTLDNMFKSRTFDAKDGGFFRYSSQPDWNEPHPEKLLEDQAGLLGNYLHVYLITGEPSRRETAEGLIDYLDSTLLDRSGGAFFGCQDYVRFQQPADTGPDSAPAPMISVIDEYIYVDANARTAAAYLQAWWLLGRDDCRERAVRVLEVLWQRLRAPGGGMYHYSDTYNGGEPRAPGILPDSVAAGWAFLEAYAVLQDEKYLEQARVMAADIVRMHRSPAGGFMDISQKGPASLQLPIAELPQNAAAAAFFVRLADLSGDTSHRGEAVWALKQFPGAHRQFGAFAAGFGHALSRLLTLPLVVTINGVPGSPAVRSLARAVLTQLGHGDVVVRFNPTTDELEAWAEIQMGGRSLGSITEPSELRPERIQALERG